MKRSPKQMDRFLVERLWPRGMKKETLQMTRWLKEMAPSDTLRRWFNHDPVKCMKFQRRYRRLALSRLPTNAPSRDIPN